MTHRIITLRRMHTKEWHSEEWHLPNDTEN
jgi:hypothetical protein